MSGFQIDTNVISEYNRPGEPDAGVKRWLETTDRQSQHVSAITLAEIQKGIELLAEGERRAQLEQWSDAKPGSLVFGRILPADRQVAGRIELKQLSGGRGIGGARRVAAAAAQLLEF